MANVFFIADTHFGHNNIITYCDRPFESVEEMDEILIQNWNKTVKPDDKIFVLGDFALASKERIIELGHILHGAKTLIIGNHDHAKDQIYYEAGFKTVVKYPILYNEFFILSHTPQNIMKNGIYANIYGHIHTNPSFKSFSPRSACVSVERTNYTPIAWEDIIKGMENARE